MDFNQFLNKKVRIIILFNGQNLTYSGTILSVDANFISFRDKYDTLQTWNISQILSISEEIR